MFVGIHFPKREGTGVYNPESFITGAEIAQGMTFSNSLRNWCCTKDYLDAISGKFTQDQLAEIAPRARWDIPSDDVEVILS